MTAGAIPTPEKGYVVAQALCEAWGIDPMRVMRIEITLDPDKFAIVEVTMLATELVPILCRYELVFAGEREIP